jgi:hypothetical protein
MRRIIALAAEYRTDHVVRTYVPAPASLGTYGWLVCRPPIIAPRNYCFSGLSTSGGFRRIWRPDLDLDWSSST